MEIASCVGLHKKDLRCRARVEVFRVTCGSERVRDGRASDAVPDGGYERDGDVAHDASFPIAFAPRDGGERGLGRGLLQYVYSYLQNLLSLVRKISTKVRKYNVVD